MNTTREMNTELVRLSRALDQAQQELSECVQAEALAEHEYRKARATSYLSTSGTVGEREAYVDKAVADERYRAHLAAGLSKSALEAVRNLRQQLSVLQTMAGGLKEEIRLARTGTEY